MHAALLWEEEKQATVGALASAGARAFYADAGSSEAPATDHPIRALVVDDLPVHQHLIKAAFERTCGPMTVVTADSGREAQEILATGTQTFDVILCDWAMPEMDGMELLAWKHANPILTEIPFIMVSARDEEEDMLLALQAGAVGYLVKPVASKILCRLTRAILADGRKAKD